MNRALPPRDREIAEIESLLRAGHAELEGLCLALADWSEELRIIQRQSGLDKKTAGMESGGKE